MIMAGIREQQDERSITVFYPILGSITNRENPFYTFLIIYWGGKVTFHFYAWHSIVEIYIFVIICTLLGSFYQMRLEIQGFLHPDGQIPQLEIQFLPTRL